MKPRPFIIHIVFLFKLTITMLFSTQLIQWNAVRWRQKIPLREACLREEKVAHLKWQYCLRRNSLRIKMPYSYLMNLVSNYLKKNILSNTGWPKKNVLFCCFCCCKFFERYFTLYRVAQNRMQRFWSIISTAFLIEYHWFLLYGVAQKVYNDLDPLFQRHSRLNAIDFYCIG